MWSGTCFLVLLLAQSLSRFIHRFTTPKHQPKSPPSLPEELIAEILLRLPVSTLVQLRGVCSSWRTLISSSQFAKDHLQRSIADPTLTLPLFSYYLWDWHYPKLGVLPIQSQSDQALCFGRGHSEILGSCNGLLCLFEVSDYKARARLWNPCTRLTSEWLEIGGPIQEHGFGYDHVHDNYKLFANVTLESGVTAAKIFTFRANSSSRTIQGFPSRIPSNSWLSASFVSGTGTLNWLAPKGPKTDIVSLDLGKETYDHLSLPDRAMEVGPRFWLVLNVLRDCLAVCFDHDNTHWAVWIMKEYGVHHSWTKLAMIPFVPHVLPSKACFLHPVYISDNDVLLARTSCLQLVRYNLKDGNIIDSSSDEILPYKCLSMRSLHISLVSPSHFGLRSCLSETPVD